MSLIQWYKLDGNILDSSNFQNDLQYVNNTGKLVSTTSAKINSCYYRQAVNDGQDCFRSTNKIHLKSDFTMQCWAKVTQCHMGTANGLVTNHSHGANAGAGITVKTISDSDFRMSCNTGTGSSRTFHSYYGTTNIKDQWHHLLLKFEKSTNRLSLWVDGVEEYYVTYSMYTIEDYIDLFNWSTTYYTTNSYRPQAYIDDVRIYNHQLSTKEVKELQKQKVLHYKFDDFQEPTENISLTDGSINWWLSNLTGQVTRSTLIDNYKYRITSTTGGSFRMNFPDGILVDGKTYNLSYNYSIMDGGPDFGMTDWCDTTLFNTVTKQGFHSAQGVKQDYTSVYKFMDFNISQNTVVDIWNVQLEQKDHYTPYTSSSRSGTILDQSGYDHHQELQLTTTPQWVDDENQWGIKLGSGKQWFDGTSSITTDQLFLDSTNQQWTVSQWQLISNNETDGQYLNNFNLGNKIIHQGSNQKQLLYINGGVNDSYTYSDGQIPELEWFHIQFVMNSDTQRCQIYLNGEEYGTTQNYTSTDVPQGFNASTIFGSGLTGYLDDIRVYQTDLSDSDILELYYDHTSLDEIGNLKSPEFLETKHKSLILDYTVWEAGQTGTITPFSCNGSTTENSRQLGLDPWGKETVIWIATPDQTSGPDGGWDSSSFQIDNTKLYRFSTWIWRNKTGNGTTYFGCHGYGSVAGVLSRSTGQNDTNPYFYWSSGAPVQGQWELWVGHIWPQGSGTGSNHSDSGRYTIDGRFGNISVDYVWRAESTSANHRSYLYYCTDITVRQHWVYPRVDICDGTEPTINELISGFDSNHIEYIRDKGGTSNLQLNVEKNSVYLGEASEVGITDGLIQWYPLNGDQEDYTPNRNNGTVYGATIATGIDGKLQYDFDGTDDYIDIGNTDEINQITGTTNITVSSWVYYDSYTSPAGQQYSVITCKSGWVWLLENPSNTLRFRITAGGSDVNVQDTTTHSLNTWYHVVGTYDGTNMKIYVNGVLKNTKQQTGTIGGSSTSGKIGTYTGSTYNLDGKIQDVRIYNRQLTQQEVGIMYDLTKESQVAMKVTNTTTYVKSQFKEI